MSNLTTSLFQSVTHPPDQRCEGSRRWDEPTDGVPCAPSISCKAHNDSPPAAQGFGAAVPLHSWRSAQRCAVAPEAVVLCQALSGRWGRTCPPECHSSGTCCPCTPALLCPAPLHDLNQHLLKSYSPRHSATSSQVRYGRIFPPKVLSGDICWPSWLALSSLAQLQEVNKPKPPAKFCMQCDRGDQHI